MYKAFTISVQGKYMTKIAHLHPIYTRQWPGFVNGRIWQHFAHIRIHVLLEMSYCDCLLTCNRFSIMLNCNWIVILALSTSEFSSCTVFKYVVVHFFNAFLLLLCCVISMYFIWKLLNWLNDYINWCNHVFFFFFNKWEKIKF